MRRTFLAGAVVIAITVAVLAPASATIAQASTAAPVPPSFRAQSQAWTSADDGFVLGTASCALGGCTMVIGTTDAGSTWSRLGPVGAGLGLDAKTEVTSIRFADAQHGWVFGPSLFATTDGGATWEKQAVPGTGKYVMALAASHDVAYMAVSGCRFGAPKCTQPASLWKTTPDDGVWHPISLTLPATRQATLAVYGRVGYLVVPRAFDAPAPALPGPDLLLVTTDGSTWDPRPVPCDESQDESLLGVAPYSDTNVALLCVEALGFGKAVKTMYRSKDTAMTTSSAGTTPLLGITTNIAAAPDGTIAMASFSIGSWIYLDTKGKTWSTREDLGDGGMGWNDPSFTSNHVGYVVYGPAGYPWPGAGQLWRTTDGGAGWSPMSFGAGAPTGRSGVGAAAWGS